MKCSISFLNVQHGDCIVTKVDRPEGVFCILIDGGKRKYRAADRLSAQHLLPEANGKLQIDLLIASHHDLDHIGGLIPLVNDPRYRIKHAWVPVVLKPNFDPQFDVQDETFTQAAIRDPDHALATALGSIENGLNRSLLANEQEGFTLRRSSLFRPSTLHVNPPGGTVGYSVSTMDPQLGDYLDPTLLSRYPTLSRMVASGVRIEGSCGCGYNPLPESYLDTRGLQLWSDETRSESESRMGDVFSFYRQLERSADRIIRRPDRIDDFLLALAATATRAYFNVTLVAELIKALQARHIPISMPLASKGSTVLIDPLTSETMPSCAVAPFHIELLSPTKELVQHYQEKLIMPPGMLALSRGINYVTVPNKMSYVFNLVAENSSALLTGDSGFTDFYNASARSFDANRVGRMKDVGLVKVPHHGGHFERFARCYQYLSEQNLRIQTRFFITSLGEGHINPSQEFEHLANVILAKPGLATSPRFLFTNPPTRSRFDLVCPQCPRTSIQGDGVLSVESDQNGDWVLVSPQPCCSGLQPAPHALTMSEAALDIPDVVRAGLWRRPGG